MSYTYLYPRPMLTVDCIIMTQNPKPKMLLIKRGNAPFKNKWALPGGFLEMDEELHHAAQRELQEETGLRLKTLTQFKTYGTLNRDPRGRTISVVFYSIINEPLLTTANSDASKAEWVSIDSLPKMAFDHDKIISDFLATEALHLH